MNERERFLATMRFETPDRVPYRPQGFWRATLSRWRGEGMPLDRSAAELFGFDDWRTVPVNVDMVPLFEPHLLEERESWDLVVDEHGITKKQLKGNTELSMPEWVDFPVKGPEDFDRMRERYDSALPGRLPPDWDERVAGWRERDYVLGIDLYHGLYMTLRQWLGPEQLLYAFYDQPGLVREMLSFYTAFLCDVLGRVLRDVQPDFVSFSEDMAYKSGPFISPAMFCEFMQPHYARIASLIHGAGTDIFMIDSDGNPSALVPPMLDAGINGLHPNEVAAGMDVLDLRSQYGRNLLLWCGLDKRALAAGRKAIEKEVRAKLPPMLAGGGYIPQVDHSVPPDVSYDDFRFYWDLLRELAEQAGK